MHRLLSTLAIGLLAAGVAAAADTTADPFLWLEEIDGEKAIEWVKAQNARSTAIFEEVPEFAPIEARFLEIYNSQDRIPYVGFRGEYLYNFWQDAEHRRGIWRRTTLDQYAKDDPKWEIMIDVDALAEADGEKWVYKGSTCLPPEYRRCMIALSPGGGDAKISREFDTVEKKWIEGGFSLPLAKSTISWRDENSLWVATDFGEGALTDSGYPRIAKLWTRGTPLEEAHQVFEVPGDWVSLSAYSKHTPEGRYDIVDTTPEFFRGFHYLILGDRKVRLDLPEDVSVQGFFKDKLLISLRSDWTVGDTTFLQDALLAIDLDTFLQGGRDFDVLFEPSERVSLRGVSTTRDSLLMTTLDNVRGRLYRLRIGEDGWTREEIPLPGPGSAGVVATSDEQDM